MIRILPALSRAKTSIKTTYNDLSSSQRYAREIGVRTAKIKHRADNTDKYIYASKFKQGIRKATPTNLPVIGFIVGFCLPVPLTSIIFAAVGAVAGAGLYLHKKMNSKNQNDKTS